MASGSAPVTRQFYSEPDFSVKFHGQLLVSAPVTRQFYSEPGFSVKFHGQLLVSAPVTCQFYSGPGFRARFQRQHLLRADQRGVEYGGVAGPRSGVGVVSGIVSTFFAGTLDFGRTRPWIAASTLRETLSINSPAVLAS